MILHILGDPGAVSGVRERKKIGKRKEKEKKKKHALVFNLNLSMLLNCH